MSIKALRLVNQHGAVFWVIYRSGHFSSPIGLLTEHEAQALVKEIGAVQSCHADLLEEIDRVLVEHDGVWQGGRLDTIKWLVDHHLRTTHHDFVRRLEDAGFRPGPINSAMDQIHAALRDKGRDFTFTANTAQKIIVETTGTDPETARGLLAMMRILGYIREVDSPVVNATGVVLFRVATPEDKEGE